MKVTAVKVYQVDLPLREGSYRWSGGKSVTVFDATVVELVTDAGVSGWGEVCPLGAGLPAGVRHRLPRRHRRGGAGPAGRRPAAGGRGKTGAWIGRWPAIPT